MVILICVVALVIWFYLAGLGAEIAEDKGYEHGKWFALCFFLAPFSHILVAALPDHVMREKLDTNNELLRKMIEQQERLLNKSAQSATAVEEPISLPEL